MKRGDSKRIPLFGSKKNVYIPLDKNLILINSCLPNVYKMNNQKPELPVKEFEIITADGICTIYEKSEEAARAFFNRLFKDREILKVTKYEIGFEAIIF